MKIWTERPNVTMRIATNILCNKGTKLTFIQNVNTYETIQQLGAVITISLNQSVCWETATKFVIASTIVFYKDEQNQIKK